jgi:hypothetical protein
LGGVVGCEGDIEVKDGEKRRGDWGCRILAFFARVGTTDFNSEIFKPKKPRSEMPTLAKNARIGHPSLEVGVERNKAGPPAGDPIKTMTQNAWASPRAIPPGTTS